jgi:hypothetical protein
MKQKTIRNLYYIMLTCKYCIESKGRNNLAICNRWIGTRPPSSIGDLKHHQHTKKAKKKHLMDLRRQK